MLQIVMVAVGDTMMRILLQQCTIFVGRGRSVWYVGYIICMYMHMQTNIHLRFSVLISIWAAGNRGFYFKSVSFLASRNGIRDMNSIFYSKYLLYLHFTCRYCASEYYVQTSSQQSYQQSVQHSQGYSTSCGFLGLGRCRRTRY